LITEYIYHLTIIREDLDVITSILYQVFEMPSFKRDHDAAFGKIADILSRYGIIENPRNLRFSQPLACQFFLSRISPSFRNWSCGYYCIPLTYITCSYNCGRCLSITNFILTMFDFDFGDLNRGLGLGWVTNLLCDSKIFVSLICISDKVCSSFCVYALLT
jgi:hypothetical protein